MNSKMIAIDQACGIAFAPNQGSNRFTFASNMIAVFPAEQVELDNREVTVRLNPLLGKKRQRDKRRLGRVGRADGNRSTFQICNCPNAGVSANDDDRSQIPIRVTHSNRFGAAALHLADTFGLQPRQW